MELNNFNADVARKISGDRKQAQLMEILSKIMEQAEDEKEVLHIYKPLSIYTVKEIEKRGFKVSPGTNITIQRDGLYFSIYWNV